MSLHSNPPRPTRRPPPPSPRAQECVLPGQVAEHCARGNCADRPLLPHHLLHGEFPGAKFVRDPCRPAEHDTTKPAQPHGARRRHHTGPATPVAPPVARLLPLPPPSSLPCLATQRTAAKFFIFLVVNLLFTLTAETIGFLCAIVTPDSKMGVAVLTLVMVVVLSFSGCVPCVHAYTCARVCRRPRSKSLVHCGSLRAPGGGQGVGQPAAPWGVMLCGSSASPRC